ncbi:MAG: M1 family metallopeptidase [Chitinophagaceae bacterium]|nr:M1 family metallopeptidase [Chitinophagaceae bacterium]
MHKILAQIFLITVVLQACKPGNSSNVIEFNPATHTFSNIKDVRTKHLNWEAIVDFDKKQVDALATWSFENLTKAKFIHFDTYDLTIRKIKVNGKEVQFFLTPFLESYGSGLSIPITEKDSIVSIEYTTGPKALAMQWLAPEQTAGKKMPYMFTQCESIQARSLIPCQDAPANRITYHASVQVPKGMMAVMSAKNPTEKNEKALYDFDMEIPIPTYLIALAIGDIEYQAIDERTGVYTEPSQLEQAARELSDIPAMMKAAEALGGPYRWGKYDVLIAPPSFPIGGMENPRLTFATPTIIAGDKSLVSLIAHEMAHSWSGNLVTNAVWDDLWLNEGFTTYFERRIMESITDTSYTEMLWELGYQDMQSDFATLGMTHADTRLRVDLNKRHPGDGFSNIPYEKGAVFLRMLERNVGRPKFDAFLNQYFSTNAFKPTTTEICLVFMDKHLFEGDTNKRNQLKVREWIYEPSLPDNCPHLTPSRFVNVDAQRKDFETSLTASKLNARNWSTHEWLQFLRKLPRTLSLEKMADLDLVFKLTQSGNSEIADEWYKLAIATGYEPAYAAMTDFLSRVGRMKFLEPLYSEMLKTPKGKEMAKKIFEQARMNYHPQTAGKLEKLLKAS